MPRPSAGVTSAPATDTAATRRRLERLAWLLDGAFPVPGTKIRFGLDSIVGLVPGVGDVAGVLLGATILYEGMRIGAPGSLLAKMIANSVADGLLGVVPVIGDIADVAFKSNRRNAALLIAHLDEREGIERRTSWVSTVRAVVAAGVFVAVAAGFVWAGWRALRWLFSATV